ncbi:MAG: phosphatidylglycerol lysyltransferase [Rhodospirillaceae bacterium]|nr:phosphatidylglycerol lysyltransferase [Rhodospirillaceae bacterium]
MPARAELLSHGEVIAMKPTGEPSAGKHPLPGPAERHGAAGLTRLHRHVLIGLVVLLAAAVAYALRGLIHALDYHRVVLAVHSTPTRVLLLAVLATMVSYAALIGYDLSALRYVGARVPRAIAGLAAFCAYALGNTVGLGTLTGGAVRYRFYSAAGLEPGKIGRIILFCAVSFVLGILSVLGLSLLFETQAVAMLIRLPANELRVIGVLCLLAIAGSLVLCALRDSLQLGSLRIKLPSLPLALMQLLLATIDITVSAAVLWVLLPPAQIDFGAFVAVYAVAIALGTASHVPGGIGVFEGAIMLAVGRHVRLDDVAAALLLYRAIYYLGPLALATLLLGGFELRRGTRWWLLRPLKRIGRAAGRLMPAVLASLTFLAGIMLLASDVTPSREEVLNILSLHVPLPILEASHFLASIAGLALLFVARGLFHRLDAAWWIAFLLITANLGLVLIRGGSVGEALALGFLLVALAMARRQFNRRASLLAQPFTIGWLLAVGITAVAIGWLLFFAFEEVPYRHDLWWQFEFDAQAPRALRAGLGVLLMLFAAGLWYMLRLAPMVRRPPGPDELDTAYHIVGQQDQADANLVMLGDKSLLFSEQRDAFIMYGQRGRSWIALFDPVGTRAAWSELIWDFLETAAASGARGAFYQVRPENLSLYLDCGLKVVKLGEEAYVPLDRFTLQGARVANLRNSFRRGERDGLEVEILSGDRLSTLLPELAMISDAWLESHATREKAFSLGAFRPDYVARQSVAVVRRDNRIIAFATLMLTEHKTEAMVDLMRHLPEAPRSTMDFLFVRLMQHCREEGYQRFNLGMAPLSGFFSHRLAPRWHRIGHLIFSHGEHFYNFQGLRAFKAKFDPVWQPRYLAAPGGLGALIVLADVAALISGGWRGIVAR